MSSQASRAPVDGQVLQTVRVPSKNKGKVIVKRLIYKKIPKRKAAGVDSLLPDLANDPLDKYYEDSDES